MLYTINSRAAIVGDRVLAASRQVWLAGLGAAVVTRDWAEKEGGMVFRNLVREGTAIESRAFRFVGDRLETSFLQANTLWKRTRRSVGSAVKTYADTAVTLVRDSMPASLPKPPLPAKAAAKRRIVRARKASASRRPAKRTRRTAKAHKRG